jgi:hypothetical protein
VSNTEPAELGEGHSPAAWTAVVIMLIGFAAGTLFFWFDMAWGVWVSAAVVVIGLVIGAVMGKIGYGVNGPKFVPKHHGE